MARILSLDDEPELLDLYRLILQRRGFEYITTTDCYEALDILRNEPIDLFMQDVMHPGLDGWQLLEMMRADPGLRDIPVLVISSIASGDCNCSQTEHLACLRKPFSVSALMDMIDRQLAPQSATTREQHSKRPMCERNETRRKHGGAI